MRTTLAISFVAVAFLTAACTTEAESVNKNLTKDADNFKITRRVTALNTRTGVELLRVEGKCSVEAENAAKATVLCKTDEGEYLRHGVLRSNDITMVWEQLQSSDTSASNYRFVLRPGALVPEVVVRPSK